VPNSGKICHDPLAQWLERVIPVLCLGRQSTRSSVQLGQGSVFEPRKDEYLFILWERKSTNICRDDRQVGSHLCTSYSACGRLVMCELCWVRTWLQWFKCTILISEWRPELCAQLLRRPMRLLRTRLFTSTYTLWFRVSIRFIRFILITRAIVDVV
jgi:hypothetical protein